MPWEVIGEPNHSLFLYMSIACLVTASVTWMVAKQHFEKIETPLVEPTNRWKIAFMTLLSIVITISLVYAGWVWYLWSHHRTMKCHHRHHDPLRHHTYGPAPRVSPDGIRHEPSAHHLNHMDFDSRRPCPSERLISSRRSSRPQSKAKARGIAALRPLDPTYDPTDRTDPRHPINAPYD